MNVVCDTNPLIYLLTDHPDYADIVENTLNGKQVWVSVITELELFGKKGLSKAEIKAINELIGDCMVVDINDEVKELTKSLMQKHTIRLPDAVVTATSLYLGFPLISADHSFSKISELDFILLDE